MKLWIFVSLLLVLAAGAEEPASLKNAKQGDVKLRTKLWQSLMENYESGINPDEPNVKFGISLITVTVDEVASTLDTNSWLRVSWTDSRLAWDTSVFPIDVLRVDFSNLWHPDVRLFNSADTFSTSTSCDQTRALIYSTGNVLWVPPCNMKSLCKTTLKAHPYEPQTCTLKFGSWTYNSDIMDIDFYGNKTSIDLTDLQDLSEWKILSTSATKNNKIYPCCPEAYTDLTFNLTLQRKPETDFRCSI